MIVHFSKKIKMEAIEQFKTKANSFDEIRKKVLIKAILSALIAVLGASIINYLNIGDGQPFLNIYIIGFILVVITFGLYRGINRQKLIFNSFKLTLNGNNITREQHNTPIVSIPYSDITEIIKNSNDSFMIKGKSTLDLIIVPSQIEKYVELEKLLANIKPISTNTGKSFLQKFSGIIPIFAIGLMVFFYVSDDKIIISICGTILLTGLLYSLFEIQKSKNIDNKTKNGMWFLLFVIASIVGVMYFKLTRI
jgi:hypothetical protein